MKRFILALITILSIFGTSIKPASAASTNDFYFSNAEFDYYLEKTETGSKLHVKEVLTAEFPSTNQNHGITRSIPYTNQDGANLIAESKSALNFTAYRNGAKENIAKTETENKSYVFYLGEKNQYVHGTQEYTLEYDFANVITEFSDKNTLTYNGENAEFQELYWDTNGTGWSQTFDHLTARLHLPADIAENLISGTSCYVGRQGASGAKAISRCTISSDDETTYNISAWNSTVDKTAETVITFEASNLRARENLTFAVNFAPGTFTVPMPKQSSTIIYATVALGIIMLVILFFATKRYIKVIHPKYHYRKSLFLAPEYTQPKGLTVADAKYIYLSSSEKSQVATLVELAVSHKIELVKSEKKSILGSKKNNWKVKVYSTDGLTVAQKDILEILNGGSAVHDNDEFEIKKHTATSHLQSLSRSYQSSTIARLRKLGLMTSETDKKQNFSSAYAILAIILLVAYFCFAVVLIAEYGSHLIVGGYTLPFMSIGIGTFITAIIIIITVRGTKIHRHTEKGIAVSNQLAGLKMYIEMAEKDRLKFLQSVKGADTSTKGIVKLYEKLLPYAIIFGAEDSWMEELNKYYEENPSLEHGWYSGTDYFTLSMLHGMMATTSSTISSSTSYSSSSSGSSGGGGGGFSGGGGGGGGGGGW